MVFSYADSSALDLAFGGVIAAMAYSIGNISGCHVNPAVSVAVLINKEMSINDFFGYIVAQFIDYVAGAVALVVLIEKEMGLGTNGLFQGRIVKFLAIQIILTFIFVLAVLGVTSKIENSKVAVLVIGGSLTFVHLMGIFFTGTSVNPAGSFELALFMCGHHTSVWVFIVSPMVGGILVALVWKVLKSKE